MLVVALDNCATLNTMLYQRGGVLIFFAFLLVSYLFLIIFYEIRICMYNLALIHSVKLNTMVYPKGRGGYLNFYWFC